MPLLHCKSCHHEFEGREGKTCDWCGDDSYVLKELTELEVFMRDFKKIWAELKKLHNL